VTAFDDPHAQFMVLNLSAAIRRLRAFGGHTRFNLPDSSLPVIFVIRRMPGFSRTSQKPLIFLAL
jgi:hypothetical protein